MNRTLLNTEMIIRKRTQGEILHNDGDFAEIQLFGIEGLEKDLLLETMQIHRCESENLPEDFQRRLGPDNKLAVVSHILGKESETSSGEKRSTVETYSTDVPGSATENYT